MFHFIVKELLQGKRLAAATVVARTGSGPREPGAMMVLPEGGQARGTIGGGLLEARTLAAAEAALRDGRSRLLRFDLRDPALSETGMVCGGLVEILVVALDGHSPDQARLFKNLVGSLHAGKTVFLLTSIQFCTEEDAVNTGLGVITGDDWNWGTLDERFRESADISNALQTGQPVLISDRDARCFVQPVNLPRCVYIAGAGHVGCALAGICATLEYPCVVIDNRSDYANRRRFPSADQIHVISSYADALSGLSIRPADAVVVVTHSHLSDRDVLAAALRTKAGYIGMIASRRKRDMIYASLAQEGFGEEDLARVHCPIGLDIGAKTPAEIAVSIAAELIALSNKPLTYQETGHGLAKEKSARHYL